MHCVLRFEIGLTNPQDKTLLYCWRGNHPSLDINPSKGGARLLDHKFGKGALTAESDCQCRLCVCSFSLSPTCREGAILQMGHNDCTSGGSNRSLCLLWFSIKGDSDRVPEVTSSRSTYYFTATLCFALQANNFAEWSWLLPGGAPCANSDT